MACLQDRGGAEYVLAVFYKTSKFRLSWQEGRSRALLLELESVEPDIGHKVCAAGCCCCWGSSWLGEAVSKR